MTADDGSRRAPDPRLHHDVAVVLGLPWSRAAGLVTPLSRDVLGGAYGPDARVRLAERLAPPSRGRLPWVPRRLDEGAAAARLVSMPAGEVADALRHLTDGASRR